MRICLTALLLMPPALWAADTVRIPMKLQDGSAITLEATLHKADAAGATPVVVFSHGSSGGPVPADYTEKAGGLAKFLNERGISLLVPMRPGRGKSEGPNREEPSACTVDAATAGIANGEAALDAAMAYLRTQSWADMSKVVLAGHSRGGLLSLAYAGDRPGSVIGAINFNGGWKQDSCATPDINVALFEAAARKTKVPALFLYGHGDGFYSDASIQRYADAASGAGVKVGFHFYTLKDINGHLLFRKAQNLWEADVERYLRELAIVKAPAA